MRLLVYSISFLLLTTISAPERLAWSSERSLQWSDFRGVPTAGDGWAASTSSGMSQAYQLDGDGFLYKPGSKVIAHFYPEYSWVKSRERTKHLLAHEQTHFDITELHARKLQKLIDDFEFTENSKEEVRQLYNKIEEERIAMQRLFDSETAHSTNHPNELRWELKIERLLEGRSE